MVTLLKVRWTKLKTFVARFLSMSQVRFYVNVSHSYARNNKDDFLKHNVE